MKIIHNRFIPFKDYDAINLFGILFCRKGTTITTEVIQHERIHTRQMLVEREAYENMHDPNYLIHRRPYAWIKYLKKGSPW